MKTKTANVICFAIASITLAAIFYDNINYINHPGKEIRLSYPIDKQLSRIQSGIEARGAASIYQQLDCSLLPSGCSFKP